MNEKIKPISKFDKQLEYVQAVLVFRGWMCGIYLPMHYNDIDTALNEKGLEHSDENRLNMAIEYLKKSDCPELEVYGYHIDELVKGLKEMVGLGYPVKAYITDVNNNYKISDFAIADHDFGTLFATKRGEDWIFVCAVRAVQCAYPSPPPPPPASLAKSVKYESSPVEAVEQVCCSL